MKIDKIKPVFSDERGSIYDVLTDENIHHVGYFTIKSGSIRGKHYHKEQKQYTWVHKGRIKVRTKNLLDKNAKIEELELGEMEMILFPTHCYHEIIGINDSECMVFTSKSRDGNLYEEDTFRVNNIESFNLD